MNRSLTVVHHYELVTLYFQGSNSEMNFGLTLELLYFVLKLL